MDIRNIMLRVAAIAGGAIGVLAVAGAPAMAHVKAQSDGPASAAGVTVTFTAAAESKTAGVAALRSVLPAGMAPSDVSYVSGPAGWTMRLEGDGFTVGGAALPTGQDAIYKVRFAKLPADQTKVALPTVQRYG